MATLTDDDNVRYLVTTYRARPEGGSLSRVATFEFSVLEPALAKAEDAARHHGAAIVCRQTENAMGDRSMTILNLFGSESMPTA